MCPELVRILVHLLCLQLESTSLIRLCRNEQVLVVLVWRLLHPLLKRTHQPPSWVNLLPNLRILKLEKQAELTRDGIPTLCNLITWTADLESLAHSDLLANHAHRQAGNCIDVLALLSLTGGAAGEVGLMFATLGMGEVGAVVLVDCETETTFEGADVVLEAGYS